MQSNPSAEHIACFDILGRQVNASHAAPVSICNETRGPTKTASNVEVSIGELKPS